MADRWDERSPARPQLAEGEVHVWRVTLDVEPGRLAGIAALLSPDEAERAARFRFERDRRRFIAGRGTLRAVLARYLSADPAELRFRYGPQGKPALDPGLLRDPDPRPASDPVAATAPIAAADSSGGPLTFNLAHSGGRTLIAVARRRRIGVDIEAIRPEVAREKIAGRFFSHAEIDYLRSLPESEHTEAFFTIWTLKEAYIKAIGGGLTIPLDRFTVSPSQGEASAAVIAADDPEASARWSLQRLFPGPGYAGALAVEGPIRRLKLWHRQ